MKRIMIAVALLSASMVLAAPNLKIGLGVWIWQLEQCENGDVDRIVARAEAAHLRHVLIKVTQANLRKQTFGWARYNNKAKVIDLASKLRAKGILVYAWGYHYPNRAMVDAQVNLTEKVLAMDCFDGFVYNVEKEFASQHEGAERILKPVWDFRNAHYPNKLLAYSTFCRVGRGMGGMMPLEAFSLYTDLAGPQVYWATFFPKGPEILRVTQSVDVEMFRSWILKEKGWRDQGKDYLCRPIIPTGQAYRKTGNTKRVSAREVAQFLVEVGGYFGCNLYLWDKMGDEHWAMLKVGPEAYIAAHPGPVMKQDKPVVAETKPVQPEAEKAEVDKAPVELAPEPSVTINQAEQAQETRHAPWWKVLLLSGLGLWFLVSLMRSHNFIATRIREKSADLSVIVRTIIVLLWAVCVMFTDGYTAANWLIRSAVRGTFRQV